MQKLTEIYATSKGKALQCDLTNTLLIVFKSESLRFSVGDFQVFRRKLKAIDIHSMLFNLSDDYDFVNLEHHGSQIILKLTLCDIIQLRDLINGTQFSLEMMSMVHEVLGDYSVV